jgi:glucosamine--fructose-6-phosphate aminotransferase (isomerizing)
MCGIVGYVGAGAGMDVVLEGLRRLEYRGYDSAGVAVLSPDGTLQVQRRAGKLSNLEKVLGDTPLAGTLAIGHTRWATHGPPTDRNAHPHIDCAGKVAVVHNGTIENFEVLVAGLEARGHERRSDTDTEVVAHLIEERYDGDLAAAVRSVCKDLEGSFVLVVAHADRPDVVVEQDVLDRTEVFLTGDLPPGLRRVVLERADDLRRCVAARHWTSKPGG